MEYDESRPIRLKSQSFRSKATMKSVSLEWDLSRVCRWIPIFFAVHAIDDVLRVAFTPQSCLAAVTAFPRSGTGYREVG